MKKKSKETSKVQFDENGRPILPENTTTISKFSTIIQDIGTQIAPNLIKDRLQPLFDAIANNEVPASLDLSDLKLNDEQAKLLGEACRKNTNLVSLNLSDNNISDNGMKSICAALEGHKNLRTLNLSQNLVQDGSSIAKLICNTQGITSLDISHNREMNCSLIYIALQQNKTITQLNLSHNPYNNSIIEILNTNNTIQCLDLSHMDMGCEGFKSICNTLGNNNNITSINIKYNNIFIHGNDDNTFLCTMLKNNKVLRRFDFADSQPTYNDGENGMGYDEPLLQAFNNNTTLLIHQTSRLAQQCVNPYLQRNMQAWKESQVIPLSLKRHKDILCFPEKGVYLFTKENGEPLVLTEKEGKKTFLGVRNGGMEEGRKFIELYESEGKLTVTQSSTAYQMQKFSKYLNTLEEVEKGKVIEVMCNDLSKELSEQLLNINNRNLMFSLEYLGRPGEDIDSNKLFTQAIEKKYAKEPNPFEAFLKMLEEKLKHTNQGIDINHSLDVLKIFNNISTDKIRVRENNINPEHYNEPTPYGYVEENTEIKIDEKQEIGINYNNNNNNIVIEEKIDKQQDVKSSDKNPENNNPITPYREKYYTFDKEKSVTIPYTLKIKPVCCFCKLDEKDDGFIIGNQVKDMKDKPILFNLNTGTKERPQDTKKEISK